MVTGIAAGIFAAREQVVQGVHAVVDDVQRVGDFRFGERDPGQLHIVRIVLDQQDRPGAHHDRASCAAGSSTWNTLPLPGSESTPRLPPSRVAMRCAIASPRPWPPPSSGPWTRWKGSNTRPA